MKCPNCGETLKDDAKVCFSCGEKLQDTHFEDLVDSMIKEDEAAKKVKASEASAKDEGSKKKKFGIPLKKDTNKDKTKIKDKPGDKSRDKLKSKTPTKVLSGDEPKQALTFGRGVQITRYVTAAIVLFFLITMLFDWFSFGGRGVFKGFLLDQNSGSFMTSEVMTLSSEEIEALDPEVGILRYSPKDLMDYVKLYEEDYKYMTNKDGEDRLSWGAMVQMIYIRGFIVVLAAGLLAIVFLLLDKKLKTVEWSRGFSVLSIVIIGMNWASMKIPFLSMFAIRTRNLLRFENQLSSVTMNFNGINMNNEFYPYNLMETRGFFIAVGACVLWFVLTTVLVEMKKDKEYA